jgi:hypothetical protein
MESTSCTRNVKPPPAFAFSSILAKLQKKTQPKEIQTATQKSPENTATSYAGLQINDMILKSVAEQVLSALLNTLNYW